MEEHCLLVVPPGLLSLHNYLYLCITQDPQPRDGATQKGAVSSRVN